MTVLTPASIQFGRCLRHMGYLWFTNVSYEACDGCCRELRRQDRVRLHVQFFVSLQLVSVVNVIWYSLVHHELLSNPVGTDSVIERNPVRQADS